MLKDVHAHLDFSQFDEDRERVIEEANEGIEKTYWIKDLEKRKKEIENFYKFIELSKELNLPFLYDEIINL